MWLALKLERACRVQLMAEWAGGPKFVARRRGPAGEEQARQPQDLYTNVFNYLVRSWCRLHGKADDPCCRRALRDRPAAATRDSAAMRRAPLTAA